ncbi:hypothetical protein GALL_426960 [mine drainage metagenome]|uniref:Uncharacterized protein n=1 Tax=mine drainage metagenome TaxID=410659 RepID=A0A1J5PVZ0_9ZZZZ
MSARGRLGVVAAAGLAALTLGACAGDPDLPRSYPQPGLFGGGHHEARRSNAPAAPYAADGAQVPQQADYPQAQTYPPQAQYPSRYPAPAAYPQPAPPQSAAQYAPAPRYAPAPAPRRRASAS